MDARNEGEHVNARRRSQGDVIVPHWRARPNVRGIMTTRRGGVSTGPYASMNLAFAGDVREAVIENRRRLATSLPAPPVWLAQVHGTRAIVVDADTLVSFRDAPPTADAAVTRIAGTPLAVLVADCLPVFLADRGGTIVGVAHAGWRGLAAGVLESTLAAMHVPPSEIAAWLGPAIGPGAFEVGRDVLDAFTAGDADAAIHFAPCAPGKWLADLAALARRRLERAGVREIVVEGSCTVSEPERFYSYRRDRVTGRMAAILWLERTPAHK